MIIARLELGTGRVGRNNALRILLDAPRSETDAPVAYV
jgi:hypothetical protein